MRDYRAERLALQEAGQMPKDWPTAAWQMFAQNYLYEASTPAQQYERIASTAAKQFEDAGVYPDWWASEYGDKTWTEVFYDLLFNVHIVGSTPVLANAGTTRGAPVSCSGGVVPNNIHGIYQAIGEVAVLSKHGFGTSVYMGDVCPRGTPFKGGGKASGTLPFMQAVVQAARDVRQGSCFPVEDGVEVLTEHGFISFSEAERRGSLVAQVLDDGRIEFVKPLGYISQEYAGDVYTLKDSRNVDIRMTGNHNVAFVAGKKGDSSSQTELSFKLCPVESKKFHGDVYMASAGFSSCVSPALTVDERLAIAYQADGSAEIGGSGKVCASSFNFKKQRKIERLESLLLEAGVAYKKSVKKDGAVSFYVKKVFADKTLSWIDIKNLSASKAADILMEVMHWDGSYHNTDVYGRVSFSYSSVIEENVKKVQQIAALCGFKTSTSVREPSGNKKKLYKIFLSEGVLFGTRNLEKTKEEYSGRVECCTVPSGKIVVLSKGKTLVIGNSRRGAVAVYIEADHADFWEWVHLLDETPDDYNFGWLLTDKFIAAVLAGEDEAKKRWVEIIRVKLITGRGYLVKIDEVNRKRPETYKAHGLDVKASNLCSEITLHSSEEYSFSCILSNLNLAKYREMKKHTPFLLVCFLDGICQSFLEYSDGVAGLEKVRNFTLKGRALGAGVCGFHTLLQKEGFAWESLDAVYLNSEVFRWYRNEAEEATKWMASVLGEPEWCAGFGRRNTHLMSMPPTKSTALLAGGVSEGINPDPKMVYLASTAAGEIARFNPVLLKIAKQRLPDADIQAVIDSIEANAGSVQGVDWLSPEEKMVFKTAFEIPLMAQLRHAEQRQKFVDQSQSANLFIAGDTDMAHLAEVLKYFLQSEHLLSLYYFYSERDAKASNGECVACQ